MHTPLWHTISIDEALARVDSRQEGLSSDLIPTRQQQYGENTLPREHVDGWVRLLLRQFSSPMIVILLVAAGMSALLHEYVDVGVILAAVVLNTAIGFIQEYRANKTMEELRSLVQPHAIVLRDHKEVEIRASEIVPGDILILHLGDRVTADARLIEVVDFMVNESALTGESMPVQKQVEVVQEETDLAERKNMLFAGTNVVGGRAKAVVVATGIQTELGRIAQLVSDTEESRTPLQDQLGRLARWLAVLVVGLVVALFVIGVVRGQPLMAMFEMSVALAVAAIPEGLIVSVTIILAIGMRRILNRKSLTRRLVAAETLGSVSIICSDKTGTITQGQMRVTHLVTPDQHWKFPFPPEEEPEANMRKLFEVMALCNDAVYVSDDKDQPLRGSPTERALMEAVLEQRLDVKTLVFAHPRVDEIPFDSAYKYMVTAHEGDKKIDVLMKGASDVVIEFCDALQVNGRKLKMSPKEREKLTAQERDLTRKGVRLIAIAVKSAKGEVILERKSLGGFTFLGFVGLRDPLREEARGQIASAREAGIRTVIVTGDHPETARAIAIEAGIEAGSEAVVVGRELDAWSDEEFNRRVSSIAVYARVEPRHKIRIIKAWQARGEVVAMTGDGVNDAPALKAADIGVAVGSGTEVAKQAADIVILDNNLGTITAAIEEGRVIFDNIRKTTTYLLSGSFTEIILIGTAIIMGLPLPLLPAHILWINLVADSFPNLGLTMEPAEKGLMKQPPRARTERVVNGDMLRLTLLVGVVGNVVLIALYLWLLNNVESIEAIRSIMFAAVGIDSLIYVYAFRSFRQTIFQSNPFSNRWLLAGVVFGFGLMILSLVHPFLQEIFEIAPLSLSGWVLLLIIGLIQLLGIEIVKGAFLMKKSGTISST